jgi:hypothetical protein
VAYGLVAHVHEAVDLQVVRVGQHAHQDGCATVARGIQSTGQLLGVEELVREVEGLLRWQFSQLDAPE